MVSPDRILTTKPIMKVPKYILRAVRFMSWSALAQGIAEIIIEILVIWDILPKIPLRLDFLSLTAVSVLLAHQTLVGISRKELDVTQDAIQVAIMVEVGLLIGDFYFLSTFTGLNAIVAFIRFCFIFLSVVNIVINIWAIAKLKLFEFQGIKDFFYYFFPNQAPIDKNQPLGNSETQENS